MPTSGRGGISDVRDSSAENVCRSVNAAVDLVFLLVRKRAGRDETFGALELGCNYGKSVCEEPYEEVQEDLLVVEALRIPAGGSRSFAFDSWDV